MGKIKSCAECRRLKLKCLRDGDQWPCLPCRRRKCDEICPEGNSITTEKASSERLLRHYRTRVAALETELESEREQSRQARESNIGASGSSVVVAAAAYEGQHAGTNDNVNFNDDRQSIIYSEEGLVSNNRYYHGRSSGAFYAHSDDSQQQQPHQHQHQHQQQSTASGSNRHALLRAQRALAEIPFESAMHLLAFYTESVTWMYSPIPYTAIHRHARRAYDHACTASEMSVVCFALALGNHFQRATDPNAEEVHPRLFALGMDCLLHFETFEKPSLEAAGAAHLCTSYLLGQGDSGKSQAAWQMLGIGIRLAVSMGLHCDQTHLGATQETSEIKAWTFWELFVYERLQSLNFGRPGLLPSVITCPRPMTDNLFHNIKYDLCDLYLKINLLLSQAQLPEHQEAMKLDAEVRAFEANIPPLMDLQKQLPDRWDAQIIPQRHMLSLLIHKALLFLHRPWFARALLSAEEPLFSPLANSFAAAVKSARQHTLLYESALKSNPMISSWWFFVFHLFTAAVVQAQVLIRSPRSLLAGQCQDDFELSYSLLGKASKFSKIASRGVRLLSSVRAEILFDFAAQASRPRDNVALLAATAIADPAPARPTAILRTTSGAPQATSAGTEESSAFQSTPHHIEGETSLSTNLSDIISADFLPPEFLNQSEWMEMDPLLQAAVYWHPQCASK